MALKCGISITFGRRLGEGAWQAWWGGGVGGIYEGHVWGAICMFESAVDSGIGAIDCICKYLYASTT